MKRAEGQTGPADAPHPTKRRRMRFIVYAALALAALLVGCNTVASKLVRWSDAALPRDPQTGIIAGAEPRTLGPEDARGAVLFIHGFAAAGDTFADLPEQAAAQGWRVRVMLLPGHGTSPFELRDTTADEYEQAVLDEIDALRAKHDTLVLVTHSMGGALATLAAAERDIDGIVLGAPYFGITYRWYYVLPVETWIKAASPIIKWVYKGKLFLLVNRKEAKKEIFTYSWLPTASARALAEVGKKVARKDALEKVTCPVLLLHPTDDGAASPRSAQKAFDALRSEDKRLVWLEQSDHHIYWDYDREEVCEETLVFLARILRGT